MNESHIVLAWFFLSTFTAPAVESVANLSPSSWASASLKTMSSLVSSTSRACRYSRANSCSCSPRRETYKSFPRFPYLPYIQQQTVDPSRGVCLLSTFTNCKFVKIFSDVFFTEWMFDDLWTEERAHRLFLWAKFNIKRVNVSRVAWKNDSS